MSLALNVCEARVYSSVSYIVLQVCWLVDSSPRCGFSRHWHGCRTGWFVRASQLRFLATWWWRCHLSGTRFVVVLRWNQGRLEQGLGFLKAISWVAFTSFDATGIWLTPFFWSTRFACRMHLLSWQGMIAHPVLVTGVGLLLFCCSSALVFVDTFWFACWCPLCWHAVVWGVQLLWAVGFWCIFSAVFALDLNPYIL